MVGKSEYVDITVTTEASVPNLVSNVRITSVKNTELSISWDAPIADIAGDSDLVERYEGKKLTSSTYFFFTVSKALLSRFFFSLLFIFILLILPDPKRSKINRDASICLQRASLFSEMLSTLE